MTVIIRNETIRTLNPITQTPPPFVPTPITDLVKQIYATINAIRKHSRYVDRYRLPVYARNNFEEVVACIRCLLPAYFAKLKNNAIEKELLQKTWHPSRLAFVGELDDE